MRPRPRHQRAEEGSHHGRLRRTELLLRPGDREELHRRRLRVVQRGQGLSRRKGQRLQELQREFESFLSTSSSLVKKRKQGNGAVVGHYTAVVWGKTTRVGCGVTSYDPSGNKAFNQASWTLMKLEGQY